MIALSKSISSGNAVIRDILPNHQAAWDFQGLSGSKQPDILSAGAPERKEDYSYSRKTEEAALKKPVSFPSLDAVIASIYFLSSPQGISRVVARESVLAISPQLAVSLEAGKVYPNFAYAAQPMPFLQYRAASLPYSSFRQSDYASYQPYTPRMLNLHFHASHKAMSPGYANMAHYFEVQAGRDLRKVQDYMTDSTPTMPKAHARPSKRMHPLVIAYYNENAAFTAYSSSRYAARIMHDKIHSSAYTAKVVVGLRPANSVRFRQAPYERIASSPIAQNREIQRKADNQREHAYTRQNFLKKNSPEKPFVFKLKDLEKSRDTAILHPAQYKPQVNHQNESSEPTHREAAYQEPKAYSAIFSKESSAALPKATKMTEMRADSGRITGTNAPYQRAVQSNIGSIESVSSKLYAHSRHPAGNIASGSASNIISIDHIVSNPSSGRWMDRVSYERFGQAARDSSAAHMGDKDHETYISDLLEEAVEKGYEVAVSARITEQDLRGLHGSERNMLYAIRNMLQSRGYNVEVVEVPYFDQKSGQSRRGKKLIDKDNSERFYHGLPGGFNPGYEGDGNVLEGMTARAGDYMVALGHGRDAAELKTLRYMEDKRKKEPCGVCSAKIYLNESNSAKPVEELVRAGFAERYGREAADYLVSTRSYIVSAQEDAGMPGGVKVNPTGKLPGKFESIVASADMKAVPKNYLKKAA
ncbi:hypothetical protein J4212_07610 [Candidatus Woesearchaeota archaeon]|nr:hypothetical protein [Candidatus Woesearchaeota archaeon]